jgi:hypothetical protein
LRHLFADTLPHQRRICCCCWLRENGNVLTFVYANQGEILCQHRLSAQHPLHCTACCSRAASRSLTAIKTSRCKARVLHFNFSPLKIMFAFRVRRCSRAWQIFDFATADDAPVCVLICNDAVINGVPLTLIDFCALAES